jgi:hypothetical protein
MGIDFKDLSPALQNQIRAQMGSPAVQPPVQTAAMPKHAGPNKTESAYRGEILARRADLLSIAYEALTIRMANGHRYTPDFVTLRTDGCIECHEVKGSYRLGSYQRAKLAFDQAKTEWPVFAWVWAERAGSSWEIYKTQSKADKGGKNA